MRCSGSRQLTLSNAPWRLLSRSILSKQLTIQERLLTVKLLPMNKPLILHSTCPHDCPSTCGLEVEVLDSNTIGRVRGAKDHSYTAGVICAKVARYAERIHHPDRLLKPMKRSGPKGSGMFEETSWGDALDLAAEKFIEAERNFGTESVWPYFYAGTMGLVQRDGIERLRHAKKYSNMFDTICTNMAWSGYVAGTGKLMGADPREMAKSDCVVIWGTNAVSTQVNVMVHAVKARKERGAKIVAIDIYRTETIEQADMGLVLRPGTDGALAAAVMHVLFRDGLADRAYMEKYTDDPVGLEKHLQSKTPQWASEVAGLSAQEITAFAHLIGNIKRTFFRLGYGFSRQRNGASNMHAALCVPAVCGHWQYEGGGAFHSNSGILKLNTSELEGTGMADPSIRHLDQSKIGRVLTGDKEALYGGPPVKAMLIQNTNPMNVAPEQRLVREGFAREDLFTVVHEQFMTDTAKYADIVLPATMFLEHDDIYKGGGHQHFSLGPKLIDAPEGPHTNHFVIEELAKRLGVADRPGFGKTEQQLINTMLTKSGKPGWDALNGMKWLDVQPDFETSHFLNGFNWPDKKFRFKADWADGPYLNKTPASMGLQGPYQDMPGFPDHFNAIENTDEQHPFRLATSPARSFLNSTFQETPSSIAKEIRPTLKLHPNDAIALSIANGQRIKIGNKRGQITLHAEFFEGIQRGVVISEGLWPNSAFEDGEGINMLTGADAVAPHGGAAFHDVKVWVRGV
jgi:anaerobic selenocysteine-containing dehydrogenase